MATKIIMIVAIVIVCLPLYVGLASLIGRWIKGRIR